MSDAPGWTLAEMSAAIGDGGLSPVALVGACLARVEALEPLVRAWTTIDRDGALAAAARCEQELAAGHRRGPLHGVPVGVKDVFYTRGLRTTMGSRIFADFIPAFDAATVERLRAAGAIVLGKTATTEFAFFDPAPTRNPWNPAHTPGGSSSGSAAAVACAMCPAALGSQTAGSLLRPGAYCGIVALKPTYGLISRHGIFPNSATLDHAGVFTRSVADAALMLDALAGHDPRDRQSSARPIGRYADAARAAAPPRIALVEEWFLERATEAVVMNWKGLTGRLAQAGARLEIRPLPAIFERVHAAQQTIMRVEMAEVHEPLLARHPDQYGSKLRAFVEEGLNTRAVDYARALKDADEFRQEVASLFDEVDIVLTPATATPAPRGLASTGDPSFNVPWTLAGVPAITLPSGVTEDRLPVGLQLASAVFEDETLLAAAAWCERAIGFRERPRLAGMGTSAP